MGKRQRLVSKQRKKLNDGSVIVKHIYKDLKDGKARGYLQRFKNGKRVFSRKVFGTDDIEVAHNLSKMIDSFKQKSGLIEKSSKWLVTRDFSKLGETHKVKTGILKGKSPSFENPAKGSFRDAVKNILE